MVGAVLTVLGVTTGETTVLHSGVLVVLVGGCALLARFTDVSPLTYTLLHVVPGCLLGVYLVGVFVFSGNWAFAILGVTLLAVAIVHFHSGRPESAVAGAAGMLIYGLYAAVLGRVDDLIVGLAFTLLFGWIALRSPDEESASGDRNKDAPDD